MTNTDRLIQIMETYGLGKMEVAELLKIPYTLVTLWLLPHGNPCRKRPTTEDMDKLEYMAQYKTGKKRD